MKVESPGESERLCCVEGERTTFVRRFPDFPTLPHDKQRQNVLGVQIILENSVSPSRKRVRLLYKDKYDNTCYEDNVCLL
jgi:hypothetical protein